MTGNHDEIEDLLIEYVTKLEEDGQKDIWVCKGTPSFKHTPIIGYGWACPYCESNDAYEEELKEKNKELQEVQGALTEKEEALNDTITEREEGLKAIEELEASLNTKEEKLREAFDRYPEFAI